jgi:hypothetical protein
MTDYDPQADSAGSIEVAWEAMRQKRSGEWRVIIYGVWPSLKPSGNPDHVFVQCFATEELARQFFAAWQGRATLYQLDSSMGELGLCAVE